MSRKLFVPGDAAAVCVGADEIARYWEKLSVGSSVLVPLAPAAWAPLYGMLVDPFGVTWVLDVEVPWAG